MKRIFFYFFIIVIALPSCSQFEKLRKSTDYALKYRKAFEYYYAGDYVRAGQLFDDIQHIFRGTNKADTVAYYQAMSYFKQRDYFTSSHYFSRIFRDHRNSPFAEESEFLAGFCYYKLSPRPSLDQEHTYQAIEAFQIFMLRHPNSKFREEAELHLAEMRDKLVDKSYMTAKLYYNLGQYKASITALNNSLDDYPETKHREELKYLLLRSSFLLADNSVPARKKERFQSTVDEYYSFVGEFPQSTYLRDAQRMYERADNFLKARATGEEE